VSANSITIKRGDVADHLVICGVKVFTTYFEPVTITHPLRIKIEVLEAIKKTSDGADYYSYFYPSTNYDKMLWNSEDRAHSLVVGGGETKGSELKSL
jgi:hypothetical protein